jgi:hypothetical protein
MTEVEDSVRVLLQDRAAVGPANPARTAEVHARVRTIQRRRAAAAVACLAVALGGWLGVSGLSGLPDRQPALAAGVPNPPYFDDESRLVAVPGFPIRDTWGELDGSSTLSIGLTDYRPVLLAARCRHSGTLRISTVRGPVADVPCVVRVGTWYQGAVVLSGSDAIRRLPISPSRPQGDLLRFEPGNSGRWEFGMLQAALPDQLGPIGPTPPLLDGPRHPAGGTFTAVMSPPDQTVPGAAGHFSIVVECVPGVRLTFRVSRGVLAVATCEEAQALDGLVYVGVPPQVSAALGLHPLQSVQVRVERSGRDTDQWRVVRLLP